MTGVDGFDIERIDEVIHGRVRLGVMAWLASADEADFTTLRDRLQATDGNLSIHLHKSFVGRKPNTRVALTAPGRTAFARYLDAIGALLNGAAA